MLFHDRQGSVSTDGAVNWCGGFGEIRQGDGGLVRLLVLLLLLVLLRVRLWLLPGVVVFLLSRRHALLLLTCPGRVHCCLLYCWGIGLLFGRLCRIGFVGRGRGYMLRMCQLRLYEV